MVITHTFKLMKHLIRFQLTQNVALVQLRQPILVRYRSCEGRYLSKTWMLELPEVLKKILTVCWQFKSDIQYTDTRVIQYLW